MKPLYTFIFICFAALGFAQTDTIQLNTGTVYTNIAKVIVTGKDVTVITLDGTRYPMQKEFITKVVLGDTIRNFNGWQYYSSAKDTVTSKPVDFVNTKIPAEYAPVSMRSEHLKTAGKFGIASTTIMVTGGMISIVGALVAKSDLELGNNLIYTGAGVSTGGFVLLIPTFAFVLKAGKED